MSVVALRPVEDSDLDAMFRQMRDPDSVWMAAFTAEDPNDRDRCALALFLPQVPVRPVHARVASDNGGSLRVLQKCGFAVVGTQTSFAQGRRADIDETILRLDD